MADAGSGRNHPEVRKCTLTPFQEPVSLAVALVFKFDVFGQRLTIAEGVDDHGMIDDEIDRHQRIDLLRIAAEVFHGVPHRGKIDDGRNAGEILHQHPGRSEGDFLLGRTLVLGPVRRILDVGLAGAAAIFIAQHVFDDDLQGERQPRDAGQAVLLRSVKRIIGIGLCTDRESLASTKAVEILLHHEVPLHSKTGKQRQKAQ